MTRAQVQFSVYVTVMLFAMSTWTAIAGVWVEMPLLVDALPEAWSLPSHLTIIIQCSNLGPALYALAQKMKSSTKKKDPMKFSSSRATDPEVVTIFIILVTAILAMMIKAFVWMVTIKDHSVPLFCLVGISALVSCTSSVVFLPYMARFKPGYISAYYIGQGLCGMLPGLLGLAQGLGQEPECIVFPNESVSNEMTLSNYTVGLVRVKYKPPLFSVSVFFGALTLLLLISTIAFYVLNFTMFCRAEMVRFEIAHKSLESDFKEINSVSSSDAANAASSPFIPENMDTLKEKNANDVLLSLSPEPVLGEARKTSTDCFIKRHSHPIVLLTTVGILNALTNGLLPATQSYTCLPYGRITYTLSIRLSSIASPLASLSTLFLPSASLAVIILLMTVASLIAVFDLILAGYSPDRIIQDLLTGQIVLVSFFCKQIFTGNIYNLVKW